MQKGAIVLQAIGKRTKDHGIEAWNKQNWESEISRIIAIAELIVFWTSRRCKGLRKHNKHLKIKGRSTSNQSIRLWYKLRGIRKTITIFWESEN